MERKIIIVGAGAVGGYVGGHLARSGEDILLIDPWPEHVDAIQKNGLHFKDPYAEYTIPVEAIHVCDVQRLSKRPVDIAFIATKSYDTEWATAMISQYLAPDGFVVSLQNSINEARIAGIVGWGKTVGCIASGISVNLHKAGHIMRTVIPGKKGSVVFRVGEVHGRITQRAGDLAEVERFLATADGDAEALAEIEDIMLESAKHRTEAGRPSTAQDILKGRRTEIDFLNGLVVKEGKTVGVAAPLNESITAMVRQIESGKLEPGPDNISGLLNL